MNERKQNRLKFFGFDQIIWKQINRILLPFPNKVVGENRVSCNSFYSNPFSASVTLESGVSN